MICTFYRTLEKMRVFFTGGG